MRFSICFIIGLLFTEALYAQKFLILEKMGTRKRFKYEIGEVIRYKVKNEDFFRQDKIIDLVDSVVVFDYGFYTLDRIRAISIKGKKSFRLANFAPEIMVAGAGFFLLDILNKSVFNGEGYKFDEDAALISAIIIGTGALLHFTKRKKVVIRKNWRLRIVDI